MSTRIDNPFPSFIDRRGRPLTGGSVYIGAPGADPEASPVDVFYNSALTDHAPTPIRVQGGFLVNGGFPASVYVAGNQYSMRVRDADGAEVFYNANASALADLFQPLDSDLSAIAALTTTAYGRALLAQANPESAREYLGVIDGLPKVGGTVTGAVKRGSAGAYVYMADAAYVDARVFVTASGAADPRTQLGDIWLEQEA